MDPKNNIFLLKIPKAHEVGVLNPWKSALIRFFIIYLDFLSILSAVMLLDLRFCF